MGLGRLSISNHWVFPSLVFPPYNLRPSVGPARRFAWDHLGTACCHDRESKLADSIAV